MLALVKLVEVKKDISFLSGPGALRRSHNPNEEERAIKIAKIRAGKCELKLRLRIRTKRYHEWLLFHCAIILGRVQRHRASCSGVI